MSDLLELSALKFYFKYLHGSLPRFFYSFNIATQGTQHSHDTRQRDQLRVDRSRINLADNRIRIFLPTLVNSTPLDLLHKITTHIIQSFSSHIKRYLINRYRDNCSNTNCYVCQYQFWCFIVINMLASFGGSLTILNTFIWTKNVNWGAKCWKISRGVRLGLHLATTYKVYNQIVLSIYMYICYLLSFCMFHFWSTETWLEKRNNDINDPSSLNPGGICDSGLSLNRYLQAHPGDTGKCPSKLTAYISIVPT